MKSQNKRPEIISLASAFFSVFILFCTLLFDYFLAQNPLFWVTYCSLTVALIFSLISWVSLRLVRLERKEEEERFRLKETYQSEDLFDAGEFIPGSIVESRKTVERYFIPIGTFLLGLVLIGLGYHFRSTSLLADALTSNPEALRIGGVSFFLFLFCLFLGSFSIGVSSDQKPLFLRPVGQWILFSSSVYLLTTLLLTLNHFNSGSWINLGSKGMWYVIIILGVELIVNVILNFYRPRTDGAKEVPIFASSLLDFLIKPHKIAVTITETLDYQFGFKVSDTWAYRFLERSLLPYLMICAFFLYLLDCVVLIDSNQRGIRERFGKPTEGSSLEPGLYLKLPRPFEIIKKFPVKKIQRINVGLPNEFERRGEMEAHSDESAKVHHQRVVLWNNQHHENEERFLVASMDQRHTQEILDQSETSQTNIEGAVPVNIMAATIPVYFKIDENKIHEYAYNYRNPEKVLEFTAARETVNYFATVDFLELMGKNQLLAKKELENRIRSSLDTLTLPLGVQILFIGLMDSHPALEIAEAYQRVVAAAEEKRSKVLGAESYKSRVLTQAQGRYHQVLLEAEGYFSEQEKLSEGVSERFQTQLAAFQDAPRVYMLRTYLDMIEEEIGHLKKYLVSSNSDQVITIDLQEKLRPDLLNDLDLGLENGSP